MNDYGNLRKRLPLNAMMIKSQNSRVVPPEADSGSAVKNIWWIRSEKLLKVIYEHREICCLVIMSFKCPFLKIVVLSSLIKSTETQSP